MAIAAPLIGDIGSCVSALLAGMGSNWAKPPADWTGGDRRAQGQEPDQDGRDAGQESVADEFPQRAERHPQRGEGASRRLSWSTKARTRSTSHAASSTCTSRASAWTWAPGASWASAWALPSPPPWTTGKPVIAVEGDSAFGFSGMEVETICRYNLPVCVIVFNNNGVYKGTDVNPAGTDMAPTAFVKDARYEMMMQAFGGVGVRATTPERTGQGAGRGGVLRQADADQRDHRRDGRNRERPHHQPEPERGEEEMKVSLPLTDRIRSDFEDFEERTANEQSTRRRQDPRLHARAVRAPPAPSCWPGSAPT